MNISKRKKAAKNFGLKWKNKGDEIQDTQSFWIELLSEIYYVERPTEHIMFESKVKNELTQNFIDAYIPSTNVLIEQKSHYINLNKGEKQSDGEVLTPYQQAKRYNDNQPYDKKARWIIVSNFNEIRVHDMNRPFDTPSIIHIENLKDEFYRLEFLVDKTNNDTAKETKVSIEAGQLVGEIYNELYKQYYDPTTEMAIHSMNVLSVRLVFCFYAEDAGLFGDKGAFRKFLEQYDVKSFRGAVVNLFKILNTPIANRDPYLEDELLAFPYVNGGLFDDLEIEIPQFNSTLRNLIIKNASSDFDWSEISPTVFGGVFESTLNPEQRRIGGMHYTSIENINKVIGPLFLDELKNELAEIQMEKSILKRKRKAENFQNKLGSLKFLDPACGSGNFLTQTYLSLRDLENQALQIIGDGDSFLHLDLDSNKLIKVNLNQFYGIEINDFAVSVAHTALWIAEAQTFQKTMELIYTPDVEFFPLKSFSNIVVGNALEINWTNIVDRRDISYIYGNPPFVGHSIQNDIQKKEIREIYKDENGKEYRLSGKIDYVAGWFFKAAQFIENSSAQVAFVATNSITQGEQVAGVWKPIYERFNIDINFSFTSFKWQTETKNKATVHVVIIGFGSKKYSLNNKKIYSHKDKYEKVSIINPYIDNKPVIFIESLKEPISDVPKMFFGSKPVGNFFLTKEEKEEVIKQSPEALKYIRKVYGAEEFLYNKERYCLWLVNISPNEIRTIPFIKSRVKEIKEERLKSKAKSTKKFAEKPTLFKQIAQPETDYILVPAVSSESRKYIPVGFVSKEIIATNRTYIVPNATLFEFGILTSNMHMAWMKAISGRFEMRYSYSNTIVYNNFPWPSPTEEQKANIINSAQNILDIRSKYPDSNLADLYDDEAMPPDLRDAHRVNDAMVMKAYGLKLGTNESDAIYHLFKLYKKFRKNKKS